MRRNIHLTCQRMAALAAVLLLAAAGAAPPVRAAAAPAAPPGAVPAQADGPQAAAIIDDRIFIPMELRVRAGTTVTWTNQGRLTHTTTSQGVWDSGRLAPGASWSLRFDTPGTFGYLCLVHPNEMRGQVVVEEASALDQPSGTGPSYYVSPPPSNPRGTNPALGGIGSVNPGLANVGAVAGPGAAVARLAPQDPSGVTGDATLLQLGATTTVSVTLDGLPPGSAHAGHVHQGGCDGPILYPLETLTADATGHGTATSTVDAPLDTGTWWVQYHASDSPPGPLIACGPVTPS